MACQGRRRGDDVDAAGTAILTAWCSRPTAGSGKRKWARGRRRAQPDPAGQELWLADRIERRQLFGPADPRSSQPPDFEAPKLWWNPSISPGGMIVYSGAMFPQWKGNLFIGALSGEALIRVTLNGAQATSRRSMGHGHAHPRRRASARWRDLAAGGWRQGRRRAADAIDAEELIARDQIVHARRRDRPGRDRPARRVASTLATRVPSRVTIPCARVGFSRPPRM